MTVTTTTTQTPDLLSLCNGDTQEMAAELLAVCGGWPGYREAVRLLDDYQHGLTNRTRWQKLQKIREVIVKEKPEETTTSALDFDGFIQFLKTADLTLAQRLQILNTMRAEKHAAPMADELLQMAAEDCARAAKRLIDSAPGIANNWAEEQKAIEDLHRRLYQS